MLATLYCTVLYCTALYCTVLCRYGTPHHCWLDPDTGFIWAFMGPVAAVVAVNGVIFVIAMMTARKAIYRCGNNDNTNANVMTML